jgi:hypothetical protein
MSLDLLDRGALPTVALASPDDTWRDAAAVAADVVAARPRSVVRLTSPEPLDAARAASLFRRLTGAGRSFVIRLSLEALESRALIEEAARAGCLALDLEREGALLPGLATGLESAAAGCERVAVGLRQARGMGIVTLLDLPLGLPEDDEGVFERAVRFCRRALVSIPVVRPAPPTPRAVDGEQADGARAMARMHTESVDNGIRWARRKLARHHAIWRRALWPTGTRSLALTAGYRQRRALALDAQALYTPTMSLLRTLNRTARSRARRFLLTSAATRERLANGRRRTWLRTRAASDARLSAFVIQIEGALDLRGARRLVRGVRRALRAGYERVTIDVRGIDAVSVDVVTRFVEQNRARLAEASGRVRIENLREKLTAVRAQIGDHEGLRLLESAVAI